MDYWMYYIVFVLGASLLLIGFYVYSIVHTQKSVFQKPTNHLEIKSWKIGIKKTRGDSK